VSPILIICCGNADRGDDGAGPLVARHLEALGIAARVGRGEAFTLMESWRGADDVVIVDAVYTGARPGTIRLWDARTAPLVPQWFRCSTHCLGVAEAVGMARHLDRLPRRLRIYGIEARRFETGAKPSAAVVKAAAKVSERLAREVALCTCVP